MGDSRPQENVMGFGDHLIYTPVVRLLSEKIGEKINIGHRIRPVVWENNPYVTSDPKAFNLTKNWKCYSTDNGPPKVTFHQTETHVINDYCDRWGVERLDIVKGEMYYSDQEREAAYHKMFSETSCDYICIEPISQMGWTPNRAYPFEKFQQVVDSVRDEIEVVQLSMPGQPVLRGVTQVNATLREAGLLLEHARGFISCEGGMAHLAAASSCPSVVIFTGYLPSALMGYPQNINIETSTHGVCALRSRCSRCSEDVAKFDNNIVIKAVEEMIWNS